MSRMTAPAGEVMTPTQRGKAGSGRLRAASKRPSASEAGFELFEGELEGAGAARFEGFGDELELAAGLVDGDAAADEDGEAVRGAEAEERGLAAEEDDGELGFAVLEGEVEVAGGSGRQLEISPSTQRSV